MYFTISSSKAHSEALFYFILFSHIACTVIILTSKEIYHLESEPFMFIYWSYPKPSKKTVEHVASNRDAFKLCVQMKEAKQFHGALFWSKDNNLFKIRFFSWISFTSVKMFFQDLNTLPLLFYLTTKDTIK